MSAMHKPSLVDDFTIGQLVDVLDPGPGSKTLMWFTGTAIKKDTRLHVRRPNGVGHSVYPACDIRRGKVRAHAIGAPMYGLIVQPHGDDAKPRPALTHRERELLADLASYSPCFVSGVDVRIARQLAAYGCVTLEDNGKMKGASIGPDVGERWWCTFLNSAPKFMEKP